jgi:cholesterol oxidase
MALDAIVVGSGFGGSVCAARLAQRGMHVLVLERGPWWGPLQRDRAPRDRRDLPRGLIGARKLIRSVRLARRGRRREIVFNADGLLEAHRFDHLDAFTASGVGGGSHIYTGIIEEPEPSFFDAFPGDITATEMAPYFERVRQMLRPAAIPTLLPRHRVFQEAVEAAGLPDSERPELAIVWGDDPEHPCRVINAAGVAQWTSRLRGDAFVGCDDGSKTTLDLTYIPVALGAGAELRPLCEAIGISGSERGYTVRYRDHRTGNEHTESAPRLILAAGGLNTQRLLFRARDRDGTLPHLPASLGRRFSPNADFAALLWKTALIRDSARGPTFGSLSRIFSGGAYRFLVGEAGLPVDALPVPDLLAAPLQSSIILLCMGRDASTGTMRFDGTGLTTSLGRADDALLYDEMRRLLARLARHYRPARVLFNPFPFKAPDSLLTVHPLGGCAIGRGPDDGFTDHRCQVFGHPGLFVADGSLYPRSPGIAPSMTIAALAERQAALME